MKPTRLIRILTVLFLTGSLLTVTLLVAGATAREGGAISSGPTNQPQVVLEAARRSGTNPHAPAAEVNLVKDDGLRDGGFVLRTPDTNVEYHTLFLNHFSAAEATFPFQLEEIHYYAGTANLQGETIQLLVYSDDDGGSPTNATLLYTETVTVGDQTGNNVYVLAAPVPFNAPTDIIIGISTIYADGGVPWPGDRFPGSIDVDNPQGDSYLAWMTAPGDPVNVANLAGFDNFIETALTGTSANLMIRGYGSFTSIVPQIDLEATVGTDPDACAPGNAIGVGAGTDVTYCYRVTNSGNVTFTNHTLTDTVQGTILSNFSYVLSPGASVFVTQTVTVNATTVSTATWTADEFGPVRGSFSASASAGATVQVVPNDPLSCNGGAVGFDNGIPGDWTVLAGGSNPQIVWTSIAFAGEAGNYTGGSGEAATASSDTQGGAANGGLYDTELRSNSFSLVGAGTPELTYLVNYQNFNNDDFLDVDISTDGGSSWTTLLSWNEDHPVGGLNLSPGEQVTLDLTAYIGEPDVTIRWRYYDPVGPQDSQDWYAQIDDVALSCSSGASIAVVKTVGTNPAECAASSSIVVPPGTEVAYCYEVTNTGPITLTLHDLVDNQLGSILSGFSYALGPGESVDTVAAGLAITATINATTVNTATWTAYNPGPTDVAADGAGATVFVNQPAPVSCNGAAVGFDLGIPPNWTVAAGGSSPQVIWTTFAAAGEAGNYTGGSGDAATASSDGQGNRGLYDTQLWTPPMNLSGVTSATLTYLANYQNFAGVDFLDVDVSTDGGSSWTTLLSWNEDHGGFAATPGEAVDIDLSAYGGSSSVIVRWRYYDPTGPADVGDWYAQIDDVALSCEGAFPGIALDMTVGTEPDTCAATDSITITEGATAYYCYEVTNTGTITLTLHDLDDSRLGSILGGFAYDLGPGESVDTVTAGLTLSATINAATVSVGTWTAYNEFRPSAPAGEGFTDVVSATDSVTVNTAVPTDVGLTGLDGAAVPSPLPLLLAGVALTLLAGLLLRRRRAYAVKR